MATKKTGIEKALTLLEKSKRISINKNNEGYTISTNYDNYHPLITEYDTENKEWNYYVSGTYNCGSDYIKIDIDELNELKDFISMLESF